MTQEEKYRRQAKILLGKINEARAFLGNHKPSIGFVGEYILRNSLQALITPRSYGICQGFVTCNGEISRQCDIIIYTKGKDSIHKSYGELKIVNAESVIAVIEVKSSINIETFHSTLKAFEQLEAFRVTNCFLFVYGKLTGKSLRRWLLEYKRPKECAEEYYVTESFLYDWPDKEWLPNSIVALESNKYFKLNHLSAYDGDWIGYSALKIKDHSDSQISCLQEFFSDILMDIRGDVIPIDIEKYSIDSGIVLCR